MIAVVNVAFEIYDKTTGNSLSGPTTFSSFFAGTPGCSNTGVFDPVVVYDEQADRFVIGVDGNGTDFCVAASTGSDPTGSWYRYGFTTDVGGNFFDYPHIGVGLDAVYMGANMFGAITFAEGRVWAMDKAAMYQGDPMTVITHSTGQDSTPQPMHLHGFQQGTWPTTGPHYFITDGNFDGRVHNLRSWDDPFFSDLFVNEGDFDLSVITGNVQGHPIDAPQMGSARDLQANDIRVRDAEYRNGMIWMSNGVSCNPGGGTVDCIQWAKIDPLGPTVVDAGVFGTDGEYRTFPDLAVNDCDDMAIGYSKTSSSMFPSTYVTGRESSDPAGSLQPEVLMKAGEITYTSFERSGPYRWGDYTEMTIDPDGQTFWYLGEYSKDTGTSNGRWGNYIGSFTFPACSGTPQLPGKASNPNPTDGATAVVLDGDLSWSAGSGATSHKVYFDGVLVSTQTETTYDPPSLLTADTTYTWRIDEVNSEGPTTGDTWTFTTEAPPLAATNPNPANNAPGVALDATLSWTAGDNATSHIVTFDSLTYPEQTGTTFDPGPLNPDTTYSWSVEEVNSAGTAAGDQWNFTTAGVPTFHVSDVVETLVLQNGNRNRWRAVGTVLDDQTPEAAPVSGVEVTGIFSEDWSGTQTDITGTDGKVTLLTPLVKNGSTFTFCVDTASKLGWVFDRANSVDLCDGPPPPPPTTGTITGAVTDLDTSLPIAGASVSTDTGESGSTDGNGNYTLIDVPTGDRTVNVSASGYDPDSANTIVTDGGTSTLNFELTETVTSGGTGTLKGTVRSTSGARLSGVSVQVDGGPSATTARNGKYTVRDVPEGVQTVTATLSGYQPAEETVTITTDSTTTQDFTLIPQ